MDFQIKNVTVGTDPEIFLRDFQTKEFISAEGVIGGTKDIPLKLKREGCAIQEDGVAAEFNVKYTTLDNPKKFHNDIQFVLKHIEQKVAKHGLEIAILPSAQFNWKQLESKQAREQGCDPDYNAWTGMMNPKKPYESNWRGCGGHLHLGYDTPEIQVSVDLMKLMDLYLGVPSILNDLDTERKKLYGQAGCFRFCEFGAEYRVLSNFWISSEGSINRIFQQIRQAVNAYNNGQRIDSDSVLGVKIQKCINTQNTELARELIETYTKVQAVEEV